MSRTSSPASLSIRAVPPVEISSTECRLEQRGEINQTRFVRHADECASDLLQAGYSPVHKLEWREVRPLSDAPRQ